DPHLDADDAPGGFRLGEAVVDGHPKGLQRDLALAIGFGPGDVGPTETTSAADADAIGPEIHGRLDGSLHGAAEGNAALELGRHLGGHPGRVEFRLPDLADVDLDLGSTAHLADVRSHHFDLLTALADDETGTG